MSDNDQGPGIDYSLGLANVDHRTGIHFGVISQNEVLQAWADGSEAEYPEPELDEDGEEIEDDMAEPLFFYVQDHEYHATQSADDSDIFILKSPYYTLCAFASPCAPGAGFLMDQREHGVKAYCFGHDWFESSKAPYRVYSVKTGEEVLP